MSENWEPVSVLGAVLITRNMLEDIKKAPEDDPDSFLNKMNCGMKMANRMFATVSSLHNFGPTLKCAQFLKMCGYYSDLEDESLYALIKKHVDNISNGNTSFNFDPREFGTMDFSNVPDPDLPKLPEDGCDEGGCDGCNDCGPPDNFN